MKPRFEQGHQLRQPGFEVYLSARHAPVIELVEVYRITEGGIGGPGADDVMERVIEQLVAVFGAPWNRRLGEGSAHGGPDVWVATKAPSTRLGLEEYRHRGPSGPIDPRWWHEPVADYRPVVDSPLDHNAMLVLCVLDAV